MIQHNMRRFKQLLSDHQSKEILNKATNGVLSLIDTEGTPYGVPISYAYDGNSRIYFHSAKQGHKIDCITTSPCCSFCVVGQDKIMPEEFTTYFRSVIVKGNICIVSEKDEILHGLTLLCNKYSPGVDPTSEIAKCINHVAVLRLDIECITGKEAIELMNRGNNSE